ncbi:hypothetical protein CRG98_032454 [Punica granatum]|uniref:Uncharacterized protein n=1 Tax=Punica granatum TaxID=22663 RepID=A0A2I0IU14_PUNGR|nr:hypothetical protein CRG98_032454 [Punica granatum]
MATNIICCPIASGLIRATCLDITSLTRCNTKGPEDALGSLILFYLLRHLSNVDLPSSVDLTSSFGTSTLDLRPLNLLPFDLWPSTFGP